MKKMMLMLPALLLMAACNEDAGSDAQTNENWPEEEITMVVPFPTGGTADRQARALASAMEDDLGVRILVDNREGGASAIGATSHFQQDPDDGTHFIYNSHPHFEATILRGAAYDFDDFDYMGIIHESPIAIWVPADSDYETLEDLIIDIEQNPNTLSYSMISSSWSDTSIKILMNELGLDARDIPYDGGAEIRTALLGGEVDFMASDIEGTIAGGGDDLRALAVFADEPMNNAQISH
ncbi:tripartite tricarboxylate transporter substrate-binding protein [Geomicrobium sp. JCM 19039]|uniref:tripartite tricarboxylate transporter substrate-binding protein n=2 Tax=unclassified Geomicrobium TaxID=2628951 RepID=UPI00045F35AB|nr:tripartite tricarboxylate transporter substrate-binding protein [Geomicrobium sp. JCM 19039]GAK14688.1 putative exported protein [Geomicrobium sp. JCM 19039]